MVMNFDGLIPVIQCHHIEQTLDFYQNALRFIIIDKTETEEGLQWAYIKSDNTFLMLQNKTTQDLNSPSNNIVLHFYTTDISSQHQFMTARGIKVGEIEDTAYYIRQFYIEDPEGNTIAIGQNINK